MTKQDLKQEKMEDMQRDALEEAYKEERMHEDFDYLLEQLGIDDIAEQVKYIKSKIEEYGWVTNDEELCDYIMEG